MQQVLPGKKGVYLYETTGTNVLHPNGRFSVVFKGIESETRQPVVIKQLHPRHRGNSAEWKRFRREFEAHPGLSFLPAHMEWIEFENHFFIIREFIPGVDFRNFISTSAGKKIKTIEEKIRFFIFLCQTVQQLHESGFIHGDIKPSNFIIQQKEQKPEIKMIDLGLAGKREEFSKSTRDENSPLPFAFHYSAPELMLNHPQLVCEATDVFSLGIMLYEWLNGSPAWFNQHPAALTNLQLTQPLPKSSRTGERLFAIIEKATLKYQFQNPPNRYETIIQKLMLEEAIEKRFSSVNKLITALENYLQNPEKLKWRFW